ncbi:winged helix-turn-helix domain-containing protein [Actinoplanes sp. NPDC049548]|uniref:winged helix-turn-helix domain-containing protein n=1 Tax=Actinoplanes sp. NPDC049548 TaxID=3155152 RepID=UPI00343EA0BD
MIRLEFGPADLAGVRFAHSPMAEVVASGAALGRPDKFWMYEPWRRQIQPALARSSLTTFMYLVVRRPHSYVPDFLTPVLPVTRPRLRDELAVVADTPLDRVAAEVRHTWEGTSPPPEIDRFAKDPAGALAVLVREIRHYFELAVAPYWSRLRAAAEAEIAHRAREAAERGPRSLVETLHPSLTWDETQLTIHSGRAKHDEYTLDGHTLALMPAGFAGPKVFTLTDSAQGRALWYPPRGYGALWAFPQATPAVPDRWHPAESSPTVPPAPSPLSALLGPTRAAVLTLLALPHSTGEVADALGVSPATASHHLTTLRDAGLIAGERVGRRLRYLRTDLGDQLGGAA